MTILVFVINLLLLFVIKQLIFHSLPDFLAACYRIPKVVDQFVTDGADGRVGLDDISPYIGLTNKAISNLVAL